jgi:valyl-tRNA synthetase
MELSKAYDAKAAQETWLKFWEEKGYFKANPAAPGEAYSIVIPPPNVTGALHMGHALNNTIQDVLIRWRRMQGRNTLWMPGTDHAGIATQAVVERLLTSEDKNFKRREYGREKMVAKIWEWKDKYEARILGQLKQMGASADFSRTRFTLDDTCAKAVRETFFRMFRDGYIYRGKRLVNWDTQLQTSVADDETYTENTKGGFWTFQYEVIDSPGTFIQFSTTRPETMLADTALCVHPSDERYQHLIGKFVTQPHTGRKIPIIADGLLADPTLGTGCVKVTPAHDPNDYACYTRNPQIELINMMNPDGTVAAGFGEYSGLTMAKAREAVSAKMEELGLFVDKAERDIPLPYSDRSKTPIQPFLSDQWFIRMAGFDLPSPLEGEGGRRPGEGSSTSTKTTPHPNLATLDSTSPSRGEVKKGLADLAIDAVTSGRVKFFPERYKNTYLDWLGEKRDWCISRQLWWGHRIPVWSVSFNFGGVIDDTYKERALLARQAAVDELVEYLAACGVTKAEFEILREDPVGFRCCIGSARAENALNALIAFEQGNEFDEVKHLGEAKLGISKVPGFPDATRAALNIKSIGSICQDPDVLDTWFSSALWPHSTMGWPEQTEELAKYYPTSTLCTSRDIITLWVARMVLTGLYNTGEIPFHHVYVHPKILDGFGETMSKSKGNGADPLDIIDLYGTDAMRFGMVSLATETQDSRMPIANSCPHCGTLNPQKKEHQSCRTAKMNCNSCKKAFRPSGPWLDEGSPDVPTAKAASDRFEQGRNFANKLWNATRFILMNLEGFTTAAMDPSTLAVEDRWILSRLASTTNAINAALEQYRFADTAKLSYEFAWSEFCDWYIEMSKARRSDPACQRVLVAVLDGIIRLIQPTMPFLAESLWEALNSVAPIRGLPSPKQAEAAACIAAWPVYEATVVDTSTEAAIALMQELVRGIREMRNRYQIDNAPLTLRCHWRACDRSS